MLSQTAQPSDGHNLIIDFGSLQIGTSGSPYLIETREKYTSCANYSRGVGGGRDKNVL